jgi:NAD(P)-dependent dehydrogenase (short-subunit alcohol dehydrogenase family)
MSETLNGKTILVTGAAKRVGKIFALACARAGADVVIHHGHSDEEAEEARQEIIGMGHRAGLPGGLSNSSQAEV